MNEAPNATLRNHRFFLLGLVALFLASEGCADDSSSARSARRERRIPVEAGELPEFDPSQSAGLFVGVRNFPSDPTLHEVPYAVDDAVDLAFRFTLGAKPRLLAPKRVLLALSGEPQKPESAKRLESLLAAGAQQIPAFDTDIEKALKQQAKAAGSGGLFVVSFATHGIVHFKRDYLLTTSSLDRAVAETSLLVSKVERFAASSKARRRLILLDACREPRVRSQRSTSKSERLSLRSGFATEGQAILAARPNELLYDDPQRRQGVFTAAVLEGLNCRAESDGDGFVSVEELSDFVDQSVARWNRSRHLGLIATSHGGIERKFDGSIGRFPLAKCRGVE